MSINNVVSRTYQKYKSAASRRSLLCGSVVFFVFFNIVWYQWAPNISPTTHSLGKNQSVDGHWNFEQNWRTLNLDHDQCDAVFPGLFAEIDRAVASRQKRHVTVEELDSIIPKNGHVRAMIFEQELYVIALEGKIYSRERATLQAIHRAIMSSPDSLPNIEFAFNTDDIIFEKVPLWGYARKHADTHIWLMPDFGYWSWPETKVGTMREVQIKAQNMETKQGFSWEKKIPKLLWRGATMGLALRERLIEASKGRGWADVKALDWHNKESMSNDLKSMSEHCQYKYLVHTEGNSYSGRLKYLQNCESVIIAHKMDWLQHHHPLMHASGPHQNYIEIDRSFDRLEQEILELKKNDKLARKIASNSVRTFRERYLTPAAESCYWRRLIQGWASVSFEPRLYHSVNKSLEWRGLPVESFLLEGRLTWEPY